MKTKKKFYSGCRVLEISMKNFKRRWLDLFYQNAGFLDVIINPEYTL